MNNPQTEINVQPTQVEYREPRGNGIRVVKVFLGTPTPRIICFAEDQHGQTPAGIFLDEALCFISDARTRTERRTDALEPKKIELFDDDPYL